MAFIFGGNTGQTYEQMMRQRSLADAYAQGIGSPGTFGEGLSALGKGLAAGLMNRSANKTETAGKEAAEAKRQSALAQLFGQRFGGGPVSAQGFVPMDAGGIPDVNVQPAPQADVSGAFAGAGAASGQNFPMSLVQSESGGNWSALNSEGYGGRLQFGKDRLADAARAGVIPAGMTGAQFSQLPPEQQQAVEQWHFADIDNQAQRMGLNSFIGQNVAGIPITQDGIRAMAHLGGIGGAAKFLQSGGQYNPADSNGTSLADYAARHGAGGGSAGGFSGGGGYSDPMAGIDMEAVTAALSDPFLDEGSKSVIAMALQDRISQRNAYQKQQLEMQNPMTQLAMRKAELEIKGLENPQPKPTDDMREYDYAVGQGYQGSFQDFMVEMKRAGSSRTDVHVGFGGEGELDKSLGKATGEQWGEYLKAGNQAASTINDLDMMDEIIELAPQGPLQGRLAQMFPGMNDAASAFDSIVKRVAPTLRAEGSGSTSDIEYNGMLQSLPALQNRPEANRAISAMMRAKAQVNQERAAVVADYQSKTIDQSTARTRIAEIDKRSIMTPELKAIISGLKDTPAAGGPKPISRADYDALPSGARFTAPDGSERIKP